VQLRQQHSHLECLLDAADRGINLSGIIFLLNDSISGYQSQNLIELIAYGMSDITYLWFKSYLLCWNNFLLKDSISCNKSQNLTELIAYGLRGITYLWFKSYLVCWKQFVEI